MHPPPSLVLVSLLTSLAPRTRSHSRAQATSVAVETSRSDAAGRDVYIPAPAGAEDDPDAEDGAFL